MIIAVLASAEPGPGFELRITNTCFDFVAIIYVIKCIHAFVHFVFTGVALEADTSQILKPKTYVRSGTTLEIEPVSATSAVGDDATGQVTQLLSQLPPDSMATDPNRFFPPFLAHFRLPHLLSPGLIFGPP